MRPTKAYLLGGAAATVLMLGMSANPAQAFDEVKWDWDAYINEFGKITVDVDVYNDPTGLVQVEKLQIQVGDVKASSYVHDIDNVQPKGEKKIEIDFEYKKHGYGHHKHKKRGHGRYKKIDEINISIKGPDPLNAKTQLPEVVSTATAVGNNQNIESDVAVMLHDGQFLFGDFDGWKYDDLDLPKYGPLSDNTNLALVEAFLNAGLQDDIEKAEVEAKSFVWDIKNASVDSSATAVGNNINVGLAYTNSENGVLMGDITQFSYADIKATSSVSDVYLNNYKNLGPDTNQLGRATVSSVATAVGNNVNITVGKVQP